MRNLLILTLATMAFVYQNCSSSDPHKLEVESNPPVLGDGALSGRVIGLYDMGEISSFGYRQSGGLAGIETSLFVGVDPVYVSGSRRSFQTGDPVMCATVMYTLTDDEIAVLSFGLSKITLRSLPATDVIVADCPTSKLTIHLANGGNVEYEFDAGICSSSTVVKTVLDDPAGLQELFEDLVTKYGCNDPL